MIEKLSFVDELNARLPYDLNLFDLSKPWDHIHLCIQCDRKFGCNGKVCVDYGSIDEIGWCAECCKNKLAESVGGN